MPGAYLKPLPEPDTKPCCRPCGRQATVEAFSVAGVSQGLFCPADGLSMVHRLNGDQKICGAQVWPYTENNVCVLEPGHPENLHTDAKSRHFDHVTYIKGKP